MAQGHQCRTFGATTVGESSGFLPNGHAGVVISYAVGGTAEDIPQTTTQRLGSRMQTQAGGLQLENMAQAMQDQLSGPEDVVAAQAGVQVVAIPEEGHFGAAANLGEERLLLD